MNQRGSSQHPDATFMLNLRWLPVVCGLLLIVQLVWPYRGWAILVVALSSVWFLSFLWARSLARGLHASREMRYGWAQVGDRIEERFSVENKSWLPALWFEVTDYSTLPGYSISRASGVGGLSSSTWRTQGVCERRGLFTLGPAALRTGDPFGVFAVLIPLAAMANLVVLPPVVPLPAIEVAPGGRFREGRRSTGTLEPSVSAARVREYLPGDSARSIHWHTSARRDSLFVRVFDITPSGDWWIVLDLDRAQQAGEGQGSTLEHGIILAASLADRGLRLGRAVGLVADGGEPVWVPARSGETQRWEVLRALTTVTAGTRPFGDLIAHTRSAFHQTTSVVVITPAVDGLWIAPLLSALRLGIVPTVLLLDRQSFGGDGDTCVAQSMLAEMGITHFVVNRALLDQPESHAGKRGQWEWRVGGTGRAVAVSEPVDSDWKALA
jgi:uncharacterized protein (DUF58 family)